jgi:hypothetical protein
MGCLVYEINRRNHTLFGAIPWLRETVGAQHTKLEELCSRKADKAHDFQWVKEEMVKVADHLPMWDIDDITYYAGDGWRFYYAVTRFRLDTQNMQSFVVLDFDDDMFAVQFKLRFSE